jgi:antitoxin component YwqK of YwqJK toxin-antitoxin module
MQRKIVLILFSLVFSISVHAQESGNREVIITTDTTYECNDMRKSSDIVETYIKEGVKILVFDNPYSLGYISEKKNNIANGLSFRFYLNTNMPKEKGMYVNGDEDGEWYYWNESGKLTMKKFWKKGKLIKTMRYK